MLYAQGTLAFARDDSSRQAW